MNKDTATSSFGGQPPIQLHSKTIVLPLNGVFPEAILGASGTLPVVPVSDGQQQPPLVQVTVMVVQPGAGAASGDPLPQPIATPEENHPYPELLELRKKQHPCYSFGLSRAKGARLWALLNFLAAIIDLIFTFYHFLYVTHTMAMCQGYWHYFQYFHAMGCPRALQTDIALTFVGSVANTGIATLFFLATFEVKSRSYRAQMVSLYTHLNFVPMLLSFPRLLITAYAQKMDHKKGCFLLYLNNKPVNFWVVNLTQMAVLMVWCGYGFWISDEYLKWLKKSRREREEEEQRSLEEQQQQEDEYTIISDD